MIPRTRLGLAIGLTILCAAICMADTWTDSTGKFTIEAEYIGVEGRSVGRAAQNRWHDRQGANR